VRHIFVILNQAMCAYVEHKIQATIVPTEEVEYES